MMSPTNEKATPDVHGGDCPINHITAPPVRKLATTAAYNELQLLTNAATQRSDEEELVTYPEDDAFGNEDGAAIRYKTMEWWHVGILMLAENISLGVLALPQALATLGIVPGLLVIFFLGVLSTYTGLVIGQFKVAFPKVQSFADCGEMIAGRFGKEVLAVSQVLILVFIMAAHILSFHVAMNAITDHAMCTTVFSLFGLLVCFALGLPRTLKAVSFLSIAASLSILVAVTVAMVSIGIFKPDMGKVLAVTPGISVVQGLGPVMNIMLAYGGHVAFFSFAAELKDPHSYPKALLLMQISAVTFYMIISAVIYYYAGPLVASPALGSAPPLFRKICYGLAMPTIVIAGVVNGSVACKYVYRRMWKGTDVIHQSNLKSIGSWVLVCAVLWTAAWVIAEAIPNFNLLLSVIASLFCAWFSFGLPGGLWLYMNKSQLRDNWRKISLSVLNSGLFLLGVTICILGLWHSGTELSHGKGGKVFSCGDSYRAPK